MKCYYHPEADAVATCSQCGKGACADCVEDVGAAMLCQACKAMAVQKVASEKDKAVASAKTRAVISYVAAPLGFLFGWSAASGARGSNVGSTLFLALALAYCFWSASWGIPVAWGWFSRLIKKFRFNITEVGELGCLLGPLGLFVAVLAFFWVVFVAGWTYGGCGGAVYEFLKYRRLSRA